MDINALESTKTKKKQAKWKMWGVVLGALVTLILGIVTYSLAVVVGESNATIGVAQMCMDYRRDVVTYVHDGWTLEQLTRLYRNTAEGEFRFGEEIENNCGYLDKLVPLIPAKATAQ
jgi:hypothetical protein